MQAQSDQYPAEIFKDKTIVVQPSQIFDKSNILLSKAHSQYLDKVILSRGAIIDRIEKLAQDIVKDYYKETVYFLVVLKGAVPFGSHLAEKINDILKNDVTDAFSMNFFFEYISMVSYEDDKSTGNVKISADDGLFDRIKGQNLVIVEDIYDSGKSMDELIKLLKTHSPKSIKTSVLFQKMNNKHLAYKLDLDYIGFLIPDEFVIGFGLDYNQMFRQLDHLCTINKNGIEAFKVKK